ncbi:sterol desaturase family protein [Candidatus Uhrbacteria bacterium]|nr:sterol desaturase family protein [Candidatus Uhrbacteria bacterium]
MRTFLIDQLVQVVQSDAIRIALVVVLVILLSNLEIIIPAQKGQALSGRLRNFGYIALFFILGGMSFKIISSTIAFQPRILSASGWSIFLLVLVGILLSDLLFYWYHRAQHAFAWLWPIHELHHADTQLNVTTSMRTYWLEYPVQVLLISVPVQLLIGVNVQVYLWTMVLMTSWLFMAHTNVRLRLGVLTPFICGPQVHRIHHSIEEKHQDKNFAQFFPFIDILFGTYYAPGKEEFPRTGTPNLASNAPYGTVLLKPLRTWFRRS